MIPEQFVHSRLKESPANNYVEDRICPHPAPEATVYPFVTYERTATVPDRVLVGPSGLIASRILVNCWARDFATAVYMGEAVRTAFDGFSDRPNGVQSVEMSNCFGDYEEDERVWRRAIELVIWHDSN